MAVSKRTRFEVFKRDGFKCQYCGRTPPTVVLQVDHVIPVSHGGKDVKHNLVTACFDCNSGKSNIPLDQVIPAAIADIELAKERLAQLKAYNKIAAQLDEAAAKQSKSIYRVMFAFGPNKPEDRSIRMFLRRLSLDDVQDAAEIAVSKKGFETTACWKYFCGICWSKIKEAGK